MSLDIPANSSLINQNIGIRITNSNNNSKQLYISYFKFSTPDSCNDVINFIGYNNESQFNNIPNNLSGFKEIYVLVAIQK